MILGITGVSCTTKFCLHILTAELACDGFSLFLLSFYMLILGIQLQLRVGFNSDVKLLMKINLLLVFITFCYMLRIIFEIYIICLNFNINNNSLENVYNNNLYWFIFSKWIPYLVPAMMLLHLMRPRNFNLCGGEHEEEETIKIKWNDNNDSSKSSVIQNDRELNQSVCGDDRMMSTDSGYGYDLSLHAINNTIGLIFSSSFDENTPNMTRTSSHSISINDMFFPSFSRNTETTPNSTNSPSRSPMHSTTIPTIVTEMELKNMGNV